MKKIIPLSLVAIVSLYAAEIELAPIGVESTVITEVAQNAQVSADIAEVLSVKIPSIDMVRRSGIANDILIRGQKRDNISIEVDGTKVYGACTNRMDPPTSHILANQIEEIEVTEGPYDVETFGVMSGGVKIKTKKPTKEVHGEISLGLGSFGYKKAGATVSGGNDFIRVLVSGSAEKSDQYEDGDGNTFSQQVKNNALQVAANPNSTAAQIAEANGAVYQDAYKDMEAYSKKSIMAKAFITLTDEQELRLSVTANRSDNVMYPNSKMDALYDDSNIYSIEYDVNNLTDTYKNVNIQYYYSDVDHPMATDYRVSGTTNTKKNWLTTQMQGLKLKNTFDVANSKLVFGLDGSKRVWDGHYEANDIPTGRKSIDDAQTKNMAVFAKLEKNVGAFNFTAGARYDSTKITSNNPAQQDNKYTGVNANLVTTYNINKNNKIFLGFGQANRVPDARELYFVGFGGNSQGTENLDQTTNREIDLGYETSNSMFSAKIKTFYSRLSNYIYIEKGVTVDAFQNIDAKVYGAEFSGEFFASDDVTIDAGAAYKRGKKDNALAGQSNTNLADMAPLRGTLGVTYEYMNNSTIRAEIQASDTWDTIDSDNGEQVLGSWTVLNLKAKHAFTKNIEFTLGVNNVFDQTYATSNTYADLTLLSSGAADVMLLNDPGRYLYTNLSYKF